MTRKVIFCSIFFIVCYILSCISIVMFYEKDAENFQTIIDNQEHMLYNKNVQIKNLEVQIEELRNANIVLENSIEELKNRQQEISRNARRTIVCEVSAYSCNDGLTPSAVMANGEVAHEGAVACNFLPIGTQVRINGNIYTVKDRCGIDNCIDIYMDSYDACMDWGRRTMEVEIL